MSHLVDGVKGGFIELDLKVAACEGVPMRRGEGEAEAWGGGPYICSVERVQVPPFVAGEKDVSDVLEEDLTNTRKWRKA